MLDFCNSDEVAVDEAKFGKMERKLPSLSIQFLNGVVSYLQYLTCVQ